MLTTTDKLRIILSKLEINQKELANKLGTTQQNISKKFKYNDWRESDVKQICSVLEIECETVFKLRDGTVI